jgi:hypothetical protein
MLIDIAGGGGLYRMSAIDRNGTNLKIPLLISQACQSSANGCVIVNNENSGFTDFQAAFIFTDLHKLSLQEVTPAWKTRLYNPYALYPPPGGN